MTFSFGRICNVWRITFFARASYSDMRDASPPREVRPRINTCAHARGKDLTARHHTPPSAMAASLSAAERRTLRIVADTLVPSLDASPDPAGFYRRSAGDLGVDGDVARIIESYVSPAQRRGFGRLLRTLESPALNALLGDRPRAFSSMSPEERERHLLGWARSRIPAKRRGFHAVKRLDLFLTYAKAVEGGRNPNWPAIGYTAPGRVERAWHRHPDDARILPIRPSTELSLDADVCIVGSGAGGSVIAAHLAGAGHRVVVLEAGAYRTADDFTQREAEAYDTMFQGHGLLTTRDLAFGVLAGQTAGGSATINWMTCLRPPMWARKEWDRDHGMAGVRSSEFDALL